MTTFYIKALAAVLMVCDHVGAVFFPDILALRVLGRLSFPLFAWLIGQGEKYSKNFKNYFLRIVVLGLISQPLYYLVFHSFRLNILATLAVGLLAIRLNKITTFKFVFELLFAALAQLINAEYGAYGVLVITLLSRFNFNSIAWWTNWSLLNLLTLVIPDFFFYQCLAILTPIILIIWNGKQGWRARWFYVFYPVHFALILIIKLLI